MAGLLGNPLLVLFAILAAGYLLRQLSIRGISVATAGVLFVALVARPRYYDELNGDLSYAVYDGTGWWIQKVDSAGHVGRDGLAGVGRRRPPPIRYYDFTHDAPRTPVSTAAPGRPVTVGGSGALPIAATLPHPPVYRGR